jgi:hypothetical protein
MNDLSHDSNVVRRIQTHLNQVLPGNFPNCNISQSRHDFTDYDFLSHGCGPLGYSGRLWEAPAREQRRFAEAVRRFKTYRHLLLGDYYSELDDPTDPFGRELHRWTDGDKQVTLHFNGAGGPGTARALIG